jgi:hypothetical protein
MATKINEKTEVEKGIDETFQKMDEITDKILGETPVEPETPAETVEPENTPETPAETVEPENTPETPAETVETETPVKLPSENPIEPEISNETPTETPVETVVEPENPAKLPAVEEEEEDETPTETVVEKVVEGISKPGSEEEEEEEEEETVIDRIVESEDESEPVTLYEKILKIIKAENYFNYLSCGRFLKDKFTDKDLLAFFDEYKASDSLTNENHYNLVKLLTEYFETSNQE